MVERKEGFNIIANSVNCFKYLKVRCIAFQCKL